MSKTIRTKVYQFEELSEQARAKAIEGFRYINVEDIEWWDGTYEDAKSVGLKITSFDLDRNRHANGEFLLAANEVAANIFRDHGENCKTYKTATNFMAAWQPVFSNYMQTEEGEDELIEIENKFLKDLLHDYSIILQDESDYLVTDQAVRETIEANEYWFTKDGQRFNKQ